MLSTYLIPAGSVKSEYCVKKSLFICYLQHTSSRRQANEFITEIRAAHKDANHNCFAFIAGKPDDPSCWGMNDDGEPRGCAGKPMFNVLFHSKIGEITCVVTRYFGGIKLGTGGMARAYSEAVKKGLDELETREKKHYLKTQLILQYALQKDVEHLLASSKAIITNQLFQEIITLSIDVEEASFDTLYQQLHDMSKGQLKLRKLSDIT